MGKILCAAIDDANNGGDSPLIVAACFSESDADRTFLTGSFRTKSQMRRQLRWDLEKTARLLRTDSSYRFLTDDEDVLRASSGSHLAIAAPLLISKFLETFETRYDKIKIFLDGRPQNGDRELLLEGLGGYSGRIVGPQWIVKNHRRMAVPVLLQKADNYAHALYACENIRRLDFVRRREVHFD